MWLLVVFGGFALIIGHAVYFSGRLTRAIAELAPRSKRPLRYARIGYLAIAVSMPASIAVYALYVLIARPDTSTLPDVWPYHYLIVYPFWLTTIWSAQCSILIVPLDLLHLGLRACKVGRGARWFRTKHALFLAIAAVFLVYVPIQIARAGSSPRVRTYRHESPALPPALDGYRIAAFGDLQADFYTDRARMGELVAAVNRADPDLVLIAGDMITRGPDYVDAAAAAVAEIRSRDGVYSCVGDHENWIYMGDFERSWRLVADALAGAGVAMLDNEVRAVEVGDATVAVALATNNYAEDIEPDTLRALLERARSADLQIMVVHQADESFAAAARDGGIDLLLSGHTHGGQIRFWTPLGDLYLIRVETPYVSGSYRLDDMLMVVTNGLGVSVVPFRYRAPATIEVIELHRR